MSSNAIESAKPVGLSQENLEGKDRQSVNGQKQDNPLTREADSEANQATISQEDLSQALALLGSETLKKQIQAVRKLAEAGEAGRERLADFVRDRMRPEEPLEPTAAHGCAYQVLYMASVKESSASASALVEEFPEGLVCPQSDRGIDYGDLQMLLVRQEYLQADKLTNQKLCAIAGESAVERKWVYFTEVGQFPLIDLQAMDILWGLYSEDKFGWSKQRNLWLRLGEDWERLWIQLQWKSTEGVWTRYPGEFVWDLDAAPAGHLPLSNQLRGVRTLDSLLRHPAWQFPWKG